MSNKNFEKEIETIKNHLQKNDGLSEIMRIHNTIELFTKIITMHEFVGKNPKFRKAIIDKINEFNNLPELQSIIKEMRIFLDDIKYRDDYIVDYFETPVKKISIEI